MKFVVTQTGPIIRIISGENRSHDVGGAWHQARPRAYALNQVKGRTESPIHIGTISNAESTTCNRLQPSRKDTPSPHLCYSANHVILRRGSVPPRWAPDYPTFHYHTHEQLLITSSTLPELQTFSAKFALAIQKINPPSARRPTCHPFRHSWFVYARIEHLRSWCSA